VPSVATEHDRDKWNADVGRRVLRWRTYFRLSRRELAERLGLSRVSVWRIEHGVHGVNLLTLYKALRIDQSTFHGPIPVAPKQPKAIFTVRKVKR
jgi:transcriptional regulator with XRE-family HTH domain